MKLFVCVVVFFFQAEDGIRDLVRSRGLGDVYKRQAVDALINPIPPNPTVTDSGSCGPGTVSLYATSTEQIFWYDAPSGGNLIGSGSLFTTPSVSYTHLRAHETVLDLVCRLLLEKKKQKHTHIMCCKTTIR